MTLLSQGWFVIAISILLTSSIFCALGLLASWVMKKRAPGARVLVLRAALIGVAFSALFCIGLTGRVRPLWNWTSPVSSSVQNQIAPTTISDSATPFRTPKVAPSKDDDEISAPKITASNRQETRNQSSSPAVTPKLEARKIAAALWLMGVLLSLAWMAVCHIFLTRLRRHALDIGSTPAADEMGCLAQELKIRAPRLLQSENVQGPLLCGLWRPAIVLPTDYQTQFDASTLRAVFLHELIHLQRRDLWWSASTRFLCALLWPQVLLWFVARHLEATGEEVCDAAVLEHGCAPRDYARCLLELAERFSPRHAERVAGAGVLPLRSALSKRVQNILDESRRHTSRASRRARVLAALFVCISAASPFIVGAASAKNEGPDLSSPEATVRSFVAAINSQNTVAAAACVQNGLPADELEATSKWLNLSRLNGKIEYLKAEITQTGATVNVQAWMKTNPLDNPIYQGREKTEFKLIRQDGQWKIAARQMDNSGSHDTLRSTVMLISPPGLAQLKTWIAEHSPATLTGRVLHEDGTPAADMEVAVRMTQEQITKLPGAPRNSFDLAPWQSALPSSVVSFINRRVKTDKNGVYTVPNLAVAFYVVAPPAYQRIKKIGVIEKFPNEVAVAPQRIMARQNANVKLPDIQLTSGALVNVRVVDQSDNKPLPDVFITGASGKVWILSSTVQTDQRGLAQFRFPAGKADVAIGGQFAPGTHTFVVQSSGQLYTANGLNTIVVDGKKSKSSGTVSLTLQKGQTLNVIFRAKKYVAPKPKPKIKPIAIPRGAGVLQGHVVYENGTPAAGVKVFAIMQKKARWAFYRGLGLDNTYFGDKPQVSIYMKFAPMLQQSSVTNANGDYRISGLTTAPYNLIVGDATNKTAYLQPPNGWVTAATEGAWAKDGQTIRRTRDLVLTPGAIISGLLRDSASGAPLGGVAIAFRNPAIPDSTDDYMAVSSDAKGHYLLRVPPGVTRFSFLITSDNLNGKVVYADTGKPAQGNIIKTSDGPHDGSKRLEYSQDGAARRTTSKGFFSQTMREGQTRRLDFWLQKVQRVNSVPPKSSH